ncbi:MAG: hypothetical protein L7F78_13305 [Syntrophales bacterium LBB04]|nr:hypothetical protein [Syntrophales bacterium LBB04]
MRERTNDTEIIDNYFPPSPVEATELLVPITTWPEIFREAKVTGIIFDEFWYDSVEDGVAYFFLWLGELRSTVLVVWDEEKPTHIECRKSGDLPTSPDESERILAEVTHLFRNAGFWRNHFIH